MLDWNCPAEQFQSEKMFVSSIHFNVFCYWGIIQSYCSCMIWYQRKRPVMVTVVCGLYLENCSTKDTWNINRWCVQSDFFSLRVIMKNMLLDLFSKFATISWKISSGSNVDQVFLHHSSYTCSDISTHPFQIQEQF